MRATITAVVLLLTAPVAALAVDPPGGPGWYQLDVGVTVTTPSGALVIAAGTPGLLVSATATTLRIRFERGVATWLGREILASTDAAMALLLTVDVDPAMVRAFVKQPQAKKAPDATTPPKKGGAEPGALGALAGTTGAGVGGRSNVGIGRETTLVIDDTVNVVRRESPAGAPIPDGRSGGPQVFPPSGSGAGSGGGGTTRVIALEEHEAWLAKILRLWGDEGARCETKSYGAGWVSICEPRAA